MLAAVKQAEAFGKDQRLAKALNRLGSIYHDLGHYNKAAKYYRRSLEIWEQSEDTTQPEFAAILNDLGVVEAEIGT